VLRFEANEVLRSRYKLLEQLGDGGFGTVWLADDGTLNRRVAIKRLKKKGIVLPDDSSFNAQMREEILQEARKISGLSHPNIIQVYDVIEEEGEALIVMEHAPGGSLQAFLKDRMREHKWIETREGVDLIHGILAGLGAAHEQEGGGIIHRDLKPANIMLAGVQPKLADFGLAAVGPVDRMPTRAGQRPWHAGSMYFMSPEQMRGDSLDHRSDLFNVGLIAFLLLGTRHPFSDEALLFGYQEMVLGGIRPIPQLQAPDRAVKAFQGWVCCLLCLRREDRYASAREARMELEECETKWSRTVLEAALELADRIQRSDVTNDVGTLRPGEVVEAVSQCRRQGYYPQAVRLFERGAFDFSGLPNHMRAKMQEDYSFCKRRDQQGENP
jgi:serine/threonine protein kinase